MASSPASAAFAARFALTLSLALSAGAASGQDKPEKDKQDKQEKPADSAPAPTSSQPAKPAQSPATPTTPATPAPAAGPNYVLGFNVKSIDGKDVDLASYKGKVVLIVNVASKCGLTPQYEALQKLFKDKEAKGLVILGFPANNFNSQEPGSNDEIATFCKSKYKVSFPMFAKLSVKGDDVHPLFKKLNGLKSPAGGEPSWNFTKYLIDRNGNAVQRFESRVRPDDAELVKKVDELLAQPVPGAPKPG